METTIPVKDIAVAVLGASAAIAAVLLVFMGFLFAHADVLPEAADAIAKKCRKAAAWGMLPVSICAVEIVTSFEWLFEPTQDWLRTVWRFGFWVEIVIFVGYAAISVAMLTPER